VVINPPDVITFRGADLKKCQFLDTDLRKVQLVDITWPQTAPTDGNKIVTRFAWLRIGQRLGQRVVVYDEIAPVESGAGSTRPWPKLERLYRELKQNHEDRRDYDRAGDFHYGEKEIRRQNPDTAWGLWFFLTLYRWFSGYGERYLPPLLWAGLLFVGSTFGYMLWGLRPKNGGSKGLARQSDALQACREWPGCICWL
jgi:hypothetical protein